MGQPVETVEEKRRITVAYRTEAMNTGKIEIVSEEEIEMCLRSFFHKTTFVNRGKKYGTMGERFVTKKETILHSSTTILRTEDVILLSAYRRRLMYGCSSERCLQK